MKSCVKRVWLLLFTCLILVVMAGCGKNTVSQDVKEAQGPYAVIHDDMGRDVTLDKKPERIVVTSASFLEPLHAVGGDVVGRPDSKTEMPDWAKDKASVGQVYQIDTEKVIALKPDLVIINKGMNEKLVQTLSDNGIPAIVLDMKSYDDVKHEVRTMAQITGEADKGEQLIADMDAKIDAIKQKIPKDARRITILHTTNQGITIQLDGSIAGCTAKLLGFDNLAAKNTPLEKNPDAAPYSLETLVSENPDILFVTSMGKIEEAKNSMEEQMRQNPAWQSVQAVKAGHVYYLPQNLFLLSPGLHYPEAVETMAKCVYPEAFK